MKAHRALHTAPTWGGWRGGGEVGNISIGIHHVNHHGVSNHVRKGPIDEFPDKLAVDRRALRGHLRRRMLQPQVHQTCLGTRSIGGVQYWDCRYLPTSAVEGMDCSSSHAHRIGFGFGGGGVDPRYLGLLAPAAAATAAAGGERVVCLQRQRQYRTTTPSLPA